MDGYYEDGALYTVTYTLSGKMKYIATHPQAAVCSFWFTGHGTGENLGWVRDDKNAALMEKLRAAFAGWYSNGHVSEDDPNTCILCIRLTDGILIDHDKKFGEGRYAIDFANQTAL